MSRRRSRSGARATDGCASLLPVAHDTRHMPVYRRRTRVEAPLETVWEFFSRPSALEALTPRWMGLSVEAVRGPDGAAAPDVFAAGSRVRLSIHPFGAGPRLRWTSRITELERREGRAWFVDVMEDGPLPKWEHAHRFFADGDATVVYDSVDYELPLGHVGRALGPLARVGFEPVFRHRHRLTRELLERGEAALARASKGET